jgi:hypothetical protein
VASTYKPSDGIDYIKSMLKGMNIDQPTKNGLVPPQIGMMNIVLNMMWMYAPWRWTLGSLTATTVLSTTQDYATTLPSDFLFIDNSYVHDGINVPRPLHVTASLPTNVSVVGNPSEIAVIPGTFPAATLRLFPKPGTLPVSPVQQVISLYKKTCPIVTEANMFTAGIHVFDDEWFWVYEEGLKWQGFVWGDQQAAAGGVSVGSNGQQQFTGQFGTFMHGLQLMMAKEKLPTPYVWQPVP